MFQKIRSDKRLLALFFVVIFILGFGLTYLVLKLTDSSKNLISKEKPNAYINATPEPIDDSDKGIFNIVFFGYGGANHDGGGLTDSIIIAHIDTNTKKYSLVSIPRDMWVSGGRKINSEASVNGYQGASAAIGGITGLPINNYIAVDFSNYLKIIDNLGGVEVEVPASFTDSFYPIPGLENETCGLTENEINTLKAQYSGFELEKHFVCRYETISYQKGRASLDGTAALKFVRSRHGDSDFGRSARQFAVLTAIKNKLLNLQSLSKLDSTIGLLFDSVKTDLTLGKIKTLIEVFGDGSVYTSSEIHLTTENVLTEGKSGAGAYVLYPKAGTNNYSEIKNFISNSISN